MNRVRIKICGLSDEAGFDAAVEAGADWVGFVFFPPSPRFVTAARAAELSARAAFAAEGGPSRVGLFVDTDPAAVAEVLATIRLDVLQLYGRFDATGMRRAFTAFPLPNPFLSGRGLALSAPPSLEGGGREEGDVWRAVGVSGPGDLPRAMDGADALVIEAKAPPGATRPGGNATVIDWPMLADWTAPGPWLLGGGLSPGNVARAIAESGANAVDVSSGVETSPGRKDPALIRAFIAAALGKMPPSS